MSAPPSTLSDVVANHTYSGEFTLSSGARSNWYVDMIDSCEFDDEDWVLVVDRQRVYVPESVWSTVGVGDYYAYDRDTDSLGSDGSRPAEDGACGH